MDLFGGSCAFRLLGLLLGYSFLDSTRGRSLLRSSVASRLQRVTLTPLKKKPAKRSLILPLMLLLLPLTPTLNAESVTPRMMPSPMPGPALSGQETLEPFVVLTQSQFKYLVKKAVDDAVEKSVQAAVAEERGKVAVLEAREGEEVPRLILWTTGGLLFGIFVGLCVGLCF